jgi:hypothetical protein
MNIMWPTFRDRELPEEDLGHVLVVMLAGVDDRDAQVDAGRAAASCFRALRARTIGAIFTKLGRTVATAAMV